MKKLILAAVAALALGAVSHAQPSSFFGLTPGQKYTAQQIMQTVGSRGAEIVCPTGNWQEDGGDIRYSDGLLIRTAWGGEFFSFTVTGRHYRLFEDYIEGGLRVGDDIESIFKIREAYPKTVANSGIEGTGCYTIFTHQEDSFIVFYDLGSKKITKVKWVIAR